MIERVELPCFSLAERDRRYAAVRAAMAARGLDCLVIPHNTGDWDNLQPDVRYLTQLGGGGTAAACVFPAAGAPIALVREPRRAEFWAAAQDWVEEIRGPADAVWSAALAQAVRDLGSASARVGLVGLAGVLREPEGIVSHGEYTALARALPQATFDNATDLMHAIRMVKSDEEIAMIERAQVCADAISEAVAATARPGVSEHALYAEMVGAHIRAGGEMPSMLLVGIGKRPRQTFLLPTFRELEMGDVIIAESEPKFAGYMAQSIEVATLGPPPADYGRLFEASLECFDTLLSAMRPGVPYAELIRRWERFMEAKGLKPAPTLGHGLGLGQDGPTTRTGGDAQGHVIEAGHCFILKPWASSADGERAVRTGNTVVVGADGARRLGRLEMTLHVVA